ncbi:MAG: 5-formyltetrahydrofolate cyclo-ligase [Colwellia sp.]|jgi:5,10-methenyltetrahydrofolate synthetase
MTSRVLLRKKVRLRRQQLSSKEQLQASEKLLLRLSSHKKVQAAQSIALYLSNDGELDTHLFIKWCWQQNKKVFLPVIHPFCPGHLLFLQYEECTPMIKNCYGITEPKLNVATVCPINQLDMLCTPLVAFDNTGARLGMGGGFYDRALANWHAKSMPYPIGIAHNCQQVEHIPTEYWDIPLPEIITPTRRIKFQSVRSK